MLVRDTALNYGSSIFVGASQLSILVVLTHGLSKAEVGAIVLSTAISGTIATASEFGVGPLIATQYQRLPAQDPELWLGLVGFLVRLMVSIAAVGVVVGAASMLVLTELAVDARTVDAIGFGVITGALSVISGYAQTFLVAKKQFGRLALASMFTAVVRIGAVVVLSILGALGTTPVLTVYLMSIAVTIGVVAPAVPRPWWPRHRSVEVSARARQLAGSVMRWVIVSRAATVVTGRLDVLLLAALAGSSAVAVYAAGYQPATPLLMFGSAAGAVALPHFGGVLTGERAKRVIRRWIGWLPFLLAIGAVAALVGYVLLPIVFGTAYARARPVYVLLVFSFALLAWMQPLTSLLYAMDRSRDVALLSVLYMGATVILEVVLIVALGIVGAAIALLGAAIVAALLALRLATRAAHEL